MEKPLHILEIMKIIKQRKAEICNRGGTGIGTENIKYGIRQVLSNNLFLLKQIGRVSLRGGYRQLWSMRWRIGQRD